MRRGALIFGLVLALASCGKYGPPVRSPVRSVEPKATTTSATPADEVDRDEDPEESEP